MTTLLLLALLARAESPERLHFEYQSLLEPFSAHSCSHQQASASVYDWDVRCVVDGKAKKFFAHVAVSFYPKTNFGVNAYEVLYWVTDTTNPSEFKHSSSTFWIHNSSPDNKMQVLEASQGIENDRAYLKLSYFP